MKHIRLLMLLPVLLAGPAGADDPTPGMLAGVCAGCHGTNGLGAPHMPMLAGLNEDYLRMVLHQYKNGERPSTIMGRLVGPYSRAELDAMAGFFAAQTWRSPVQEVEDKKIKRGEKVHREKCEMCHKDNGRFMDAETPRIAGQGISFLEAVLLEYKDEERRLMKKYMKKLMEKVRERDITALAHFYASQR